MKIKKILVTGKNSFIGNAFFDYINKNFSSDFEIVRVSLKDKNPADIDFSDFDIILHVAGIAHVDKNYENDTLYYKINRDLTYDVCRKAKSDGVKHFIFLSSIIVYGESRSLDTKLITKDTVPVPNGAYGNSKLEAENLILPLSDDKFSVSAVRPPMIYGKGCKGNYPRLSAFAVKSPVFPYFENRRSMLHIDNLCEFLRLLCESGERGVFFPQNSEYINPSLLVKQISLIHGKNICLTKAFNPAIRLLSKKMNVFSKLFGGLVYDKNMSAHFNNDYCIRDFEESIRLTEV